MTIYFIRAVEFFAYAGFIISAFIFATFIWEIFSNIKWCKQSNRKIISYAYSSLCENRTKKSSGYIYVLLLVLSFVAFLIINPAFQSWIGLHNLYLESDGEYMYYAEFYEYSSKETYCLPAKILIDEERFYVESVKLPSGKIVEFYTEDLDVKPGEYCYIFDTNVTDDGEWGECKLLNQHAYSPDFVEKSVNWFSVLLLVLNTIFTTFTLSVVFKAKIIPQNTSSEE